MKNDFLKGLVLFAAGFLAARYLIKKSTPANNTSVTDSDGNVIANVEGIVSNVKEWIKTNFPEISHTEAETYAAEATGVTLVPGQVPNPHDGMMLYHPAPDSGMVTPGSYLGNDPMSNVGYAMDQSLHASMDQNDFFQASNKVKRSRASRAPVRTETGNMAGDYRWSFN